MCEMGELAQDILARGFYGMEGGRDTSSIFIYVTGLSSRLIIFSFSRLLFHWRIITH